MTQGAFTCDGWQITLYDPIWQVTLYNCAMGFSRAIGPTVLLPLPLIGFPSSSNCSRYMVVVEHIGKRSYIVGRGLRYRIPF